jgi:AraC-like DNA-binding protein
MYAERRSAVLHGVVVWERADAGPARILPDGCTDLIWTGEDLVVAGPDTTAHISTLSAPERLVAVRFPPGVGPSVFRTPATELRDRRVPLEAIWAAGDVRRLNEQLAGSAHPARTLEQAVAQYAANEPTVMTTAAALLLDGHTVDDVADGVGLSSRQLHRRSLVAFGYGPKLLGQILRFGRALGLARAGVPFAHVAAEAGYSDQAHLSRDVKRLAGVTLGELLA